MKHLNYIIATSVLLCVILACKATYKNDNEKSMNQSGEDERVLEQNIKEKGDIQSYDALRREYMDGNDEADFFKWAKLMADKYDYDQAYLDVYRSLYFKQDIKIDDSYSLDYLNTKDQQMAIAYLKQGAEKGHPQAKEILGKYYMQGKYVTKDTILGNRLLLEADSIRTKK